MKQKNDLFSDYKFPTFYMAKKELKGDVNEIDIYEKGYTKTDVNAIDLLDEALELGKFIYNNKKRIYYGLIDTPLYTFSDENYKSTDLLIIENDIHGAKMAYNNQIGLYKQYLKSVIDKIPDKVERENFSEEISMFVDKLNRWVDKYGSYISFKLKKGYEFNIIIYLNSELFNLYRYYIEDREINETVATIVKYDKKTGKSELIFAFEHIFSYMNYLIQLYKTDLLKIKICENCGCFIINSNKRTCSDACRQSLCRKEKKERIENDNTTSKR